MLPSLLLKSVVMVKGSREDLTATLVRTRACLFILWDRRFHSNESLFCCIRLKSVRRLIWLRRRTWSGCHVVWTSQFREKNVYCRIHGIHTVTVLMRHITHVVPLLKPSCDHLYKDKFLFPFLSTVTHWLLYINVGESGSGTTFRHCNDFFSLLWSNSSCRN